MVSLNAPGVLPALKVAVYVCAEPAENSKAPPDYCSVNRCSVNRC